MSLAKVKILFAYNTWATRKILSQLAQLTQEQYTAPASVPFGSLRGTLVHTMSAQWMWRSRFQEHISPTGHLAETDYPDVEALLALWQKERDLLDAYLETLSDAVLLQNIDYLNTKGVPFSLPLHHILTHMVNHGTQHRSEAAILLTEYGYSPGDLDYIYYVIDNPDHRDDL